MMSRKKNCVNCGDFRDIVGFGLCGPDGMILMEYRSLVQEPTLLLQHFPTSKQTMSLPQIITLFCREVPPVHVRIVLDERTQQPKAIWHPGRRRIDHQPLRFRPIRWNLPGGGQLAEGYRASARDSRSVRESRRHDSARPSRRENLMRTRIQYRGESPLRRQKMSLDRIWMCP